MVNYKPILARVCEIKGVTNQFCFLETAASVSTAEIHELNIMSKASRTTRGRNTCDL